MNAHAFNAIISLNVGHTADLHHVGMLLICLNLIWHVVEKSHEGGQTGKPRGAC